MGHLRLKEGKDVLKEVERLVEPDPDEILNEGKLLIEMDFNSLYQSSFEKESYWIRVMKVEPRTCRHTVFLWAHRGASAC